MPNIKEIVDAYIKCGNTIGFFYAEMILMKHLPDNNPDGKCYDVPEEKRPEFLEALQKATKEGYS